MATKKATRSHRPALRPRKGSPRRAARGSDSYLALARAFPLCPLRSEADLDRATRVLEGLLSRTRPLDAKEQDYLEVLSHEIERYEAEAYPMPEVSGADMLRYLIDQREVTLSEVAQATGVAVSTLSDILNQKAARKRKLNLDHIQALAPYFGVEPAVFLDGRVCRQAVVK